MEAKDILNALQYDLSMAGLESLDDAELRRMREILHHWESMATSVYLERMAKK